MFNSHFWRHILIWQAFVTATRPASGLHAVQSVQSAWAFAGRPWRGCYVSICAAFRASEALQRQDRYTPIIYHYRLLCKCSTSAKCQPAYLGAEQSDSPRRPQRAQRIAASVQSARDSPRAAGLTVVYPQTALAANRPLAWRAGDDPARSEPPALRVCMSTTAAGTPHALADCRTRPRELSRLRRRTCLRALPAGRRICDAVLRGENRGIDPLRDLWSRRPRDR